MPNTGRTMIALAGGLLVASCASPPPDTFEITSPRLSSATAGQTRAQILIPEPTAIRTLNSDKIVVRPTPYSVEYLGASQWGDNLPRMVQLRLLQAFENTGRVGAVGVPGQGLAIDYQLLLEIRKFEIVVQGGPVALVEISAKALNDRSGNVVRTRIFTAQAPVTAGTNSGYVAALDNAYSQVSNQIVGWALTLL